MASVKRGRKTVKPKGEPSRGKKAPARNQRRKKTVRRKKKKAPRPTERRFRKKTSRASAKAWETRRRRDLAARNGLSEGALDFWAKLNRDVSDEVLDLRFRSGVYDVRELPRNERLKYNRDTIIESLRIMQRVDSRQWRAFSRRMRELGFTPQQIKTAWFSPKARKAA